MNAAQIHLALNHAPLFLSAIGGILLLAGIVKDNTNYKTPAFYMLIAAALFTLPVFFTGEGTEEIVEGMPGVSEQAIEQHEGMAKISLVIILVSGVVALAGLVLKRKPAAKMVITLALIGSLASFAAMGYTAHLGGKIKHPELGAAAATGGENEKEAEDDD